MTTVAEKPTAPGPALATRDYQAECLAAVHAAFTRGVRRPAVVLPTGTGKTVIFSHLIRQFLAAPGERRRVVVLAHRDELVTQARGKILSVAPHLPVGVVKGGVNETDAAVVVASVQTLRNPKRAAQVRDVGLVIVDECFPAGTLVGGQAIESLRPGDLVPSWDEATGQEVTRPVVRVMRKVPESMVRVTFEDGRTLDCTPNHPLMTAAGWCPAGALSRDDYVISFTHHAETNTGAVRQLPESSHAYTEGQNRHLSPVRPDVLLGRLPGRMGEPGPLGADGADERGSRVGEDDCSQSNGTPRGAGEDGRNLAQSQAPASHARWEWYGDPGTATRARRAPGMAHRGDRGAGGRRAPLPLQAGHSAPVDDGVRRGGRGIPLLAGPPALRPAPGRAARGSRVAHVQILERGRDGTYGGVCGDGAVYNLEVEGTHTYLVGDGVVAHNCHHATATSYLDVLDFYGCFGKPGTGARAVGFTATMERSDGVALGNVWEEIVYEYPILKAIRRGYLCDPVGYAVKVADMDMSKVRTTAGDFREGDLGDALSESSALHVAAEKYLELGQGQQGLAFLPTVATAHETVSVFAGHGIEAAAVDGATPSEERRAIVRDYTAGNIPVLSNCMVFTEGTDFPNAAVALLMRPTQSRMLYVQMAGRVLRPDPERPGKVATLLDISGAAARHSLIGRGTLLGADVEPEDGESLAELDERILAELAAEATGTGYAPPKTVQLYEADDYELDLFHGQRLVWHHAPRTGVPFVTLAERLVLVMPDGQGAFDVAWIWRTGAKDAKLPGAARGGWIARHVADHGYALAWAEGAHEDNGWDPGYADRTRAWRKRKVNPQGKQAAYASALGIDWLPDWRAGQLADAIDTKLTGRLADAFAGPYLTKIGALPR